MGVWGYQDGLGGPSMLRRQVESGRLAPKTHPPPGSPPGSPSAQNLAPNLVVLQRARRLWITEMVISCIDNCLFINVKKSLEKQAKNAK